MGHVTPAYGQISAAMSGAETSNKPPLAALCSRIKKARIAVRNWVFGTNTSTSDDADDSSTAHLAVEGTSRSVSTSSDYTELHRGSVPCPSCNGSGLIPKELESTLVALIPVNDERLKPKKTWLIVSFWVSLCAIIAFLLLFMLMPRSVTLSSYGIDQPIELVHVTQHNETLSYIDFNFLNKINVTSGNYIPVDLVNLTVNIISKFMPYSTDIVGTGRNDTLSEQTPIVLYRTTHEVLFNNSVALKGAVADYCQASYSHLTSLYVTLQFDISVSLRYYYGHQEQVTLSTMQPVCCVPSGNCTAPNFDPF